MKKFCIRKSLKMALIMGAFQGGMTLLGWMLSIRFSHFIRDFDHWIAFLLLAYLGGKMIYESLRQEESCLTSLSDRTLLTLGVATSIDALAVGVGLAFLKQISLFRHSSSPSPPSFYPCPASAADFISEK